MAAFAGAASPSASNSAIDHRRQLTVAMFVQMDAVDRQRPSRLTLELQTGREQIDERHVLAARHFAHRGRIDRQPRVVRLAVGQIAIVQILVRDRREDDQSRRSAAVVLLAQRVADELRQVLLELG